MRKVFCAYLEIFIDTVNSSQICPTLKTNRSSRDWTCSPVPEFSVCAVGYVAVLLTWSSANLVGKLGMILLVLIASAITVSVLVFWVTPLAAILLCYCILVDCIA